MKVVGSRATSNPSSSKILLLVRERLHGVLYYSNLRKNLSPGAIFFWSSIDIVNTW